MTDQFNFELISPDKMIFSTSVNEVILPSYEGQMTILKDHIPIITFLRPGIIEINSTTKKKKYFIEDGTVEFFNNKLLVLSQNAKDIDNFQEDEISAMIEKNNALIKKNNLSDKDRYILSYKIETLKNIK